MKRAFVLLNGNPPSDNLLSLIKPNDLTVCADGAFAYIKGKIMPDLLLGDYDSLGYLPDKNLAKEVRFYPVEKDFTDGSLAVKSAVEMGAEHIVILGALGGRVDHLYANISLLYLAKTLGVTAEILDENTQILLINGTVKKSVKLNSTVSLVPFFDEAHILKAKGLKYLANGIKLTRLRSDYGVSNEAIEEEIEIETEGEVLLFITQSGGER